MASNWFRNFLLLPLLLLAFAAPATSFTPAPTEEDMIRSTIFRWYEELKKKDKARVYDIVAPGFIDASPHYTYPRTRSRAGSRPVYNSLAATALRFRYDVESIRSDSSFAKVRVWERGYYYAFAAKVTYERGASTLFVLERRESDGRWLILAHESSSQGIPPNKITSPMPDLRSEWERTQARPAGK